MSQIGESSATVTFQDKRTGGKKKDITVRCLIFFDGTLNNKQNIEGRLDYEKKKNTEAAKAYKQFRLNPDKEADEKAGKLGVQMEEDSHENDYSNIVRLQQNVLERQPGHDETVIIYMEGAGTVGEDPEEAKKVEEKKKQARVAGSNEKIEEAQKFGKDEQPGFAFAAGETGVKTKVTRGIFKAIDKIVHGPDEEARDPTKFIIKKLTIDIFGFSRGATCARYCVHELLKEIKVIDEASLASVLEEGGDSGVKFRAVTYTQHKLRSHWLITQEVEVCFVGLFDTVSSFKSMQLVKLLPLENWFVKLKAIGKAKKVVQLASADEHRYHFSLHNIDSAGGKGEQYFLPGTHSDIGGGYLPDGTDAGLIVYQGGLLGSHTDRKEYLTGQGWYRDDQLETTAAVVGPDGKISGIGVLATALGELINVMGSIKNPRTVSNAYCQIPLKIMAEKADENGVKFKLKLRSKATETINAYPELANMESRIRAHMAQFGPRGSKPEHWHKPEFELNPELKRVRNKHFHFSARYNTYFGHNPRRSLFTNKRKRFEFDG